MRRFGISLFIVVLAALALLRGSTVLADAPVAGIQLRAISSTVDGPRAAVLVEASEPVAYVALQPDPRTLLLELRDVSSAGFANGFRPQANSPIQQVDVEDGRTADGSPIARVRVGFARKLTPKVRSRRNLIFIEAEGTVQDQVTPARSDTASGTVVPPAMPKPLEADAATSLRSIESHVDVDGIAVILEGNGRLIPRNVHETGSPNNRVVLDFHGLTPAVRTLTNVAQGTVERVRVAVNSREPLVTRVVFDLSARTPYRIEPLRTDGRRIRVVFTGDGPTAAVAAAANAAAATPAVAATPAPRVINPPPPADALEAIDNKDRDVATAAPEPVAAPQAAATPAARPAAAAAQATEPPAAVAKVPPAAPARVPAPAPAATHAQGPTDTESPAVLPAAAPAAAPPQASGSKEAISRSGAKVFSGHPVSLDFQGADLRAVLRTFAEISGLNIVIDPAVQGSVDVALRDVPWDQALDIILRANKLGYFVDGTIVRVAPLNVLAEEEKQRRRLTEEQALSGELRVLTKTLSYAQAAEIAPLLTKSALSPRGSVQVDPRTNTLIISDLQQPLDTAASLIATLDQPQPQVEIEARIVRTSRNFARELGIQWGFSGRAVPELGNTTGLAFPNRIGIAGSAGPNGQAVNLPTANPPTSAASLALGSLNGAFNLDVRLTALEESGNLKILSTPRISTQNNVEAEIMQGDQIPIQTIANNTVTVTFKDAALTLKVVPQITAAKTVIMNITVENATADFGNLVGGIPPISTQRAITRVLVRDGETTVIGGIYESVLASSQDRTPGLSRIPLLGWLFRNNVVRDTNDELLIFITPKIIPL
jgi:type IV pilus secretin PilQ/predicted competence protein